MCVGGRTFPSTTSGSIIILKHDVHCLGLDKWIIVGKASGITLSLHGLLHRLEKSFTLALKCSRKHEQLLAARTSPTLPQETLPFVQSIEDDYVVFVRGIMYVHLLPSSGNNAAVETVARLDNNAAKDAEDEQGT